MADLKNCPFCGKAAELRSVGHRVIEWVVLCPREMGADPCSVAPISRHRSTPDAAIAAWNTRADTRRKE